MILMPFQREWNPATLLFVAENHRLRDMLILNLFQAPWAWSGNILFHCFGGFFRHWRGFFEAAELLYQQEQQQQQHQRQEQPQYRQTSNPQPRHSSLPTHPYRANPNPTPYQNRPQPPISQQAQQRLPPSQPYNNNQPPPPNPSYNTNSHQSMISPPPQNYGIGAPPQIPHGRSPPLSRPPPTPSPGRKNASDASLFPLFKAVDKNGTGQLSEKELRTALVNGDWTSFDPHTVKMMIRLFDVNKSGTIGFDEFWSVHLVIFSKLISPFISSNFRLTNQNVSLAT